MRMGKEGLMRFGCTEEPQRTSKAEQQAEIDAQKREAAERGIVPQVIPAGVSAFNYGAKYDKYGHANS